MKTKNQIIPMKPKEIRPIIFIPGIEATALANVNTFGFDLVWNGYDTLGGALGVKILGPYIEEGLQEEPIYDEKLESIIERNHIARLPFERTLQNLRKSIPDAPIYLFGYDWRKSNIENGKQLVTFVEYLKGKLNGTPGVKLEGFRFLTQSMGGLVFTCFLKHLNRNYSDIDKVILCAPPFRGSAYALIHMIKGDGGIKGLLNQVFGRNEDIRKVIRTYPALYELLPWYRNAFAFTEGGETDLINKDHWQPNVYDDIENLFDRRLKDLETFRNSFLNELPAMPPGLKDRIIVLVGEGETTSTSLKIQRTGAAIPNMVRLDLLKQGMADGDGTVPIQSSTYFKDKLMTLAIKKENIFEEPSNNLHFHGLFLRDSRVQNIIKRFFNEQFTVQSKFLKPETPWWQSIGDLVRRV